jgi:hypothetical protein
MKKIFFGLIAIVMFSFNGFANTFAKPINFEDKNITESAFITFEKQDSKTTYGFNSVKDFVDYSNQIIESLDELPETDRCTMTITMSVTVTVNASVGVAGGSVSTTVTGSITASCDAAVSAGKKLRAQLISMAGG